MAIPLEIKIRTGILLNRDFAVALKATAKFVRGYGKHPGNPDLESLCENILFEH